MTIVCKIFLTFKSSKIFENWKPFECNCENCGQNLLRKWILNERILRHLGLKPFKCDYNECDKSFGRKECAKFTFQTSSQ